MPSRSRFVWCAATSAATNRSICLSLLIGYAISGERTLADFFERTASCGTAFMALFRRTNLPHRSSLSRFLAGVDRPCLEAFRGLFKQYSFADGWTEPSIGGIWDRQGRRSLVFDVDATRQAARQRSLPCTPDLPAARRRLAAVCAPGDSGRKRGEVVRTRTTALQMHTRQWIGTYAGRGNGDYREELASALRAVIASSFTLQTLRRGGAGAAGWAIWGRHGDRSTASGRRVPRDAWKGVEAARASPDPTRADVSTNSQCDHTHHRGNR